MAHGDPELLDDALHGHGGKLKGFALCYFPSAANKWIFSTGHGKPNSLARRFLPSLLSHLYDERLPPSVVGSIELPTKMSNGAKDVPTSK